MPARKGSKQLVQKQALLGKFQRNNKVIKEMELIANLRKYIFLKSKSKLMSRSLNI